MKKLISAAWQGNLVNWNTLSRSLLQYRNTPCRSDGLSPAQKLFGHPVQDTLLAHRRSIAQKWQRSSKEADKAATTRKHAEQAYNQHTQELTDLSIGSHVAIQNPTSKLWDIYGVVTALASQRRYLVRTKSGRVFVRNRRFLRKRIPVSIGVSGGAYGTQESLATAPIVVPRRSTREKQAPQRLAQDPTWLVSSLMQNPRELEGEV